MGINPQYTVYRFMRNKQRHLLKHKAAYQTSSMSTLENLKHDDMSDKYLFVLYYVPLLHCTKLSPILSSLNLFHGCTGGVKEFWLHLVNSY